MTSRQAGWAARGAAVVTLLLAAMIGLTPTGAAAAAPVDISAGVGGPEQVAQGQTAVYLFQGLTKTTPRPANMRVTLKLPAGLTYESAEPGAVSCGGAECPRNSGECTADAARTLITCTADNAVDIADGHFSYTATVRVAADAVPGTKLTVVAEASSDGDEATPADNTYSFTSTVIIGADLGLTAVPPAAPVVPGKPVTFSIIVHNYGPATVKKVTLQEGFTGPWYGGGKLTNEGTDCFADPGLLVCEATVDLAPGAEVRLNHSLPTSADDDFWGLREQGSVRIFDLPDEAGFDTANNHVTFPIVFAKKPAGTPATSATPVPTTPADGGGAAGGLPITGAATLPLALTGLLLLLGGAAAILLTRRRGRLG
jgi:hypothetical protein